MELIFIRHFMTKGNLEKRYIGRSDEHIELASLPSIEHYKKFAPKLVYISPMLRCRESASYIYPKSTPIVVEQFKECDFGVFENHNYEELKDNYLYREWIASNGKKDILGMENHEAFKKRCVDAFDKIMLEMIEQGVTKVAFVVHGGTIMAILEKYANPRQEFYQWQIKNGEGFLMKVDEKKWSRGEKNLILDKKV